MTTAARGTRPAPATQPLPAVTAGESIAAFTAYTEIPEDAGARPAISIGDQLATEMPGFDILPCGHCGAAFDGAAADLLGRTHVLGILNYLAAQAGWRYDTEWTWTCPQCQHGEAWKARQGQLEVRPARRPCERHDGMDGGRRAHRLCTCPGAVLAVDVMLASKDYEDIDALAAAALRRSRLRFDTLSKAAHPEHGYQPGRHRSPAAQQRGAA